MFLSAIETEKPNFVLLDQPVANDENVQKIYQMPELLPPAGRHRYEEQAIQTDEIGELLVAINKLTAQLTKLHSEQAEAYNALQDRHDDALKQIADLQSRLDAYDRSILDRVSERTAAMGNGFMTGGQAVLNTANRDYFNSLIEKSRRALADSLPHDVTVNIVDESEETDYIPVEIDVLPAQRQEFVRLYVDELDSFGNDLLGRPLSEVFEGCVSEEQEATLQQKAKFDAACQNICARIWQVAYTLILEQRFAEVYQAAQVRFTDYLYNRAYESYYEKRDERGYTAADYQFLADSQMEQSEPEME